MRLLIINFEYPPLGGGGAVATQHLAQLLSERHDVHVLTSRLSGLPAFEAAGDVTIHRVWVWRRSLPTANIASLISFVPAALWRGWWLCRAVRFEVINAQFAVPSGVPAVLLARLWRVPFVLSFIGGDIYDPTKGISPHRHVVLRWLIRRLAALADKCTAISEDTRRRAQELVGVDRPIVVTPLGIFPGRCEVISRGQLGLPEAVPVFISIGRLIPRKGYELLLEAWREVPEAHLVVVGEGPLRERLQAQAQQAGLAGQVHFTGFVTEERKLQLLRAADAYVSGAAHEGFGLVFLEAMDAGLPIVSTNEGGHRDFLRSEEHALLVPVGDAAQLAAAVRRLLADRGLRERMRQANVARVCEFYWARSVAAFERVLQSAQSRRHGSGKAYARGH